MIEVHNQFQLIQQQQFMRQFDHLFWQVCAKHPLALNAETFGYLSKDHPNIFVSLAFLIASVLNAHSYPKNHHFRNAYP